MGDSRDIFDMHVLCICKPRGGLWAYSPRKIWCYETTSSEYWGMMNNIWEKLYYAYSPNNIQHILTCKTIMNPKCYITSYNSWLLIFVRSAIVANTHVYMPCPLSCVIERVVSWCYSRKATVLQAYIFIYLLREFRECLRRLTGSRPSPILTSFWKL